ncbi:ABC transporter substrate-binding protein [Aestuariispira insulae]|nr:ABC transporter substrate-binding protein [Aestuariispira insulae]
MSGAVSAQSPAPILIGLDADMSSGSAQSGEAIRRGIVLAIEDINATGGVLDRPVKLVVRDHRGNPARGNDNLLELADMPDMVAVFSGIHTPVVLKELKTIHEKKLLFLVPWAAGTPIIDNDYQPNFVFRVSVRDQYAGAFLVDHAMSRGFKKLGLLFEQTGWGRSNERAVSTALTDKNTDYAGIEWFSWGITDLSPHIERLRQKGADAILLVANPKEGGVAVHSMAALDQESSLPIISHWGISGGNFFQNNQEALSRIDFQFLQTFSFFDPPDNEMADRLWQAYQNHFPETRTIGDVPSPVGTAHAYDLMKLLAVAIRQAGTTDRASIRDAMENLPAVGGVMKHYDPPFTPAKHDALGPDSFIMARYDDNGSIIPAGVKP